MSDDNNGNTGKPRGMRKGLTSYGDEEFSLFLRKAFIKGAGYSDKALDRPVIGITDTGSGFNPCHGNVPQLVTAVERGILMAGGLPVQFPTISPRSLIPKATVLSAPGQSIVVNSPPLQRNPWVMPPLSYRPTISPRALISRAVVKLAPGESIDTNSLPLSRYPCVVPPLMYWPTMSPRALMPRAKLELAPGKSIDLNSPSLSKNPRVRPPVTYCPTISPRALIP